MKKIKIIIFDLDGTLVDAYRAVASSVNYSLGKMGYPSIDDGTIKRRVGWGDRNLIQSFVQEDEIDKILSIYRQHHAAALKSGTTFLPGAKELLDKLKNSDYLLAIASNRPTRFTQIVLKHLRIDDYFEHVLCADKVRNAKPAPDLLMQILEKFSLSPDEAIYVGDMAIDIETGHGAKVRTVAVVTGSSTQEEIVSLKPFRIIRNISEVADIVETFDNH